MISRRQFCQRIGAGALTSAWGTQVVRGAGENVPERLVIPTPAQVSWQDKELGLVYHFDLDVYMPGGHDHERSRREVLDPALYRPSQLDTDQWLAAAKAMGAGYAVLTATHHQGFLQWQSDAYPFGLKQSPWRNGKADLVADFVESCRKVGIAPGLYIGIRFNAFWDVYNYDVNGGRGGDPARRAAYMRVCETMVRELCSRYGDFCEVWFDGGVITPEQGGPDVQPIVEQHQPNAVFYHSPSRADHRWAGNEAGTAGDPCWATIPDVQSQAAGHRDPKLRNQLLRHGDPKGRTWCPAMCDAPIREHDWLWIPGREDRLQSVDRLMHMYTRSVGRNANLILGAVPDNRGLVPDADFARYAEFGREIRRRFGAPAAETSGEGGVIDLALREPVAIDYAILMENIRLGERVRAYELQGWVSGPERWTTLCRGESIGHKRIHEFDATRVAAARLLLHESVAPPVIAKLAIGNTRSEG